MAGVNKAFEPAYNQGGVLAGVGQAMGGLAERKENDLNQYIAKNAPEFAKNYPTLAALPGYLNYMRGVITSGIGAATNNIRDIQADYTAELALATNPDALIDRVALLLNAGSLSAETRASMRAAISSVTIGLTNAAIDQRNRVNLAVYLVMASPEYIFQN